MNHFYKKMGQETGHLWNTFARLKFLMLTAFLLVAFAASAQNVTVSGQVTDGSDGSGLPGVTILEKGTSNGTTTDFDGNFSLTVSSSDAVLVVSSVGFAQQEIVVGNQTNISISMSEDVQALGEIVVIGYGTVKKSDLTGSVTAINADDFNKGPTTSPQDLIVGRMAGVSVINDGGAPGAGATIRIRGGSSLSASNNPLFVIDGVVISDEGISGVRNPLSMINPNDIENVTVLKDASATAIYGARASNGVIIVTTKRGKDGQAMTVGYSAKFSMQTLPKTVDVLSSEKYQEVVGQAVVDGDVPAAALSLFGNESTDWQNQIFENAFAMDHNISISGGAKGMPEGMTLPYRASVGYTNQDGILKSTNFERISASIGLDPTFLNGDLQVQVNAKYSNTANTFTNEGAIGSAVTFDPTQAVRASDSPWGGYFYWEQGSRPGFPITIAPANPVSLLNSTDDGSNVNRFLGNVKATYKIPFVEGLSATINGAIDRSNSEGATTVDEGATWEWQENNSVSYFGRTSNYSAANTNDLVEYYMNYTKDIDAINSTVDVLGGYSWQEFTRKSFFESYDIDRTLIKTPKDTSSSENRLISFYGRVNLNVAQKYLFTFTLRRDGSSRFAEGNQWGLFPSAAVAWRIKDESFLQGVNFLTELKLRAGYGVTGQENVGSPYPAVASVSIGNDYAIYPIGGVNYRVARFEGYDANLKWEETTTINAGVDFGFWDNRITGSFDYFNRTTEDLLNVIDIPIGTNLTNRILTNVGTMEIDGVELALNAIVVDNGGWKVELGYNVTHVDNKITKLTAVDDPSYLGVETGGISGGVGSSIQIHSVGFPRSSFFTWEQVYDADGRPIEGVYVDQNGDGTINVDDRVRMHRPDPTTYMGFNSNVSYKNYFFGFNARMNLGNYNYNNVASQYATFNNAYNTTGYTANLHSDILNTGFANSQYFSSYYVQDASFFRMDNIFVGYRFDQLFTDRVAGTINFTVQNAFVITKYEGLDPEVSSGIDNNLYPRPRVYSLGLNINFK